MVKGNGQGGVSEKYGVGGGEPVREKKDGEAGQTEQEGCALGSGAD